MLTTITSGSTDKEWAVVIVAPVRSSPMPAVTTDTAPARCRIANFREIRVSSGRMRSVSVIWIASSCLHLHDALRRNAVW